MQILDYDHSRGLMVGSDLSLIKWYLQLWLLTQILPHF